MGYSVSLHEYVWLLVQSTVEFYISWEKLQCTLLEHFPVTTKLVYCVLFSNHTESVDIHEHIIQTFFEVLHPNWVACLALSILRETLLLHNGVQLNIIRCPALSILH